MTTSPVVTEFMLDFGAVEIVVREDMLVHGERWLVQYDVLVWSSFFIPFNPGFIFTKLRQRKLRCFIVKGLKIVCPDSAYYRVLRGYLC